MEEAGVVKWFDFENRGYGFIASAEGGPDVFAHIGDVVGGVQLKAGDKVSYAVAPGRDGRLKAINVRLR